MCFSAWILHKRRFGNSSALSGTRTARLVVRLRVTQCTTVLTASISSSTLLFFKKTSRAAPSTTRRAPQRALRISPGGPPCSIAHEHSHAGARPRHRKSLAGDPCGILRAYRAIQECGRFRRCGAARHFQYRLWARRAESLVGALCAPRWRDVGGGTIVRRDERDSDTRVRPLKTDHVSY